MHLRRSCLPAALALFVALALVPFTAGGVAADADYAASCTVRLRASPSVSGEQIVTMPAGTVVTAIDAVAGEPWSATCASDVSGTTWFAITAVNGTSVLALYGVVVAYAATGLFQPSTSPPPVPAVYLEGIDVSHHKGTIDWAQVPGAGKRFAIMKATEGQTFVDPLYAENHAGARSVGVLFGAYHFAFPLGTPGDAVLQADWFAQNAALLPGDLVPALDLEQSGGLSTTDLQAWVGAWLGEVSVRLGVRPMIYTSPSFWANRMGDTTMFADQGYAVVWVAHWFTSSPRVPAGNWGGRGWTFWQYSNCGSVAGISGCVDLDRYIGADLTGLTFNYGPLPPVAPPVAPPSAPPGVPPILAAIAPATAPAGGGDLPISILGADFVPGVSIGYWDITPLATTFVSPTQLNVLIPAALVATLGTGSVTVVNQPPGVGTSAPAPFIVTAPTPPPTPLSIGATTARGLKPAAGYSVKATRTQARGKYITWKFSGGPALAGQRVNVLVAKRIKGVWGAPRYLKSARADSRGIVMFWSTSRTAATMNVRIQWPGDATFGPSTSPARGASWK